MPTVYVATTGSDANTGDSPATAKATIAGGLAVASPGDTVLVADGTYVENLTTNNGGSSAGGHITIRSENKHGAIISGTDTTVVLVQNEYLTFQDLQITGPNSRYSCDIIADNVTVRGCWIHDVCNFDTAGNSGSAIEIYSADGLYTAMANILIEGNLIHNIGLAPGDNQLVQGIYVSTLVTNGLVVNNVVYEIADFGLHAFHSPDGWFYINNTVAGCGRGILTEQNFVTRNNISFNNLSDNYDIRGTGNVVSNNLSGGTGATAITGVTVADPLFTDYAGRDFTLAAGSPALDAGTSTDAPATDIDGTARPQGAAVDIGAYEMGTPHLKTAGFLPLLAS